MSSAGVVFTWPMRSFANWPGISAPSLLSNTARTRTVPLRGVDLVVHELQVAGDGRVGVGHGAHLDGDALELGAGARTGRQLAQVRALTTCSSASKLA